MSVEVTSGQRYKLVNKKNSKLVLDLSGANNRSVIGYEWHGGDNQKWEMHRTNNGWAFKNVGTGLHLAVEGHRNAQGNYSNGTKVICTQEQYEWHIWQEKGVHRIDVPNTKKSLDLSNHGAGPDVEIWGTWEGENQLWKFENV